MDNPSHTNLLAKEVRSRFTYDPCTGVLYYKKPVGNRKVGDVAGIKTVSGYLRIKLNKKSYGVHRIIWLLVTGKFPEKDIDHINGIKTDNTWGNLREATRQQNIWNTGARSSNHLGIKGVRKLKDTGKYQVRLGGKCFGCYKTLEEASYVSNREQERLHKSYCFKN